MRSTVLVFACVAACAAPPPPASPPGATGLPSLSATRGVPVSAAAAPATGAARPAPVCRVAPLPAAPAPAPTRACTQVPRKLQAELRTRLTSRYEPSAPGATLEVRFACDPLANVVELVLESSRGHGGRLVLVRLRREGGKISALRISGDDPVTTGGAPVTVERAEIEAVAVDRLLPRLRGLVSVALDERVPGDATSRSGRGSSASWYGLVRLVDAAGRSVERGYTGSDTATPQSLPVDEVVQTLRPLLGAAPWRSADVDDDARSLFVARYLAAGPGRAVWWVKERLVRLAAEVGTPALVPGLVALARDVRVDASVLRTRELALAALAKLAGFDARAEPNGGSTESAAAIYAELCRL